MEMAWISLLIASIFEIGWAIGLKYTEGFTRPTPSFLVAVGILASFVLLARAVRTIPIGTAYAVFAGIGAGGTGFVGILLLGEPAGLARILSIISIVAGIIGVRLFGNGAASSIMAAHGTDDNGDAR
jgi:quaternary ammonium compound-resistance protein SugE